MDAAYFDANATTPLDPRVGEEMARIASELPGNPASAHSAGRRARAVLEDSRERIAARLGARPREVVFTSGGTESVNLALLGFERDRKDGHLVVSSVEHPATLKAAEGRERQGWRVTRLPVDAEGRVDPAALRDLPGPAPDLVSVMLANNETGAIQPVRALADDARGSGAAFHADASQAVGRIPVNVGDLGVDLLSAGAHKLGGPRGIGVLWVRTGVAVSPILGGGPQEGGLRPGTVPVALAAGFARALDLAAEELPARAARLAELRERLAAGIAAAVPGARRVSPREGCLPNTLNVTVPGVSGEALLMALDAAGFCVATGSACATGSALPSHVLTAQGLSRDEVSSSIRLSLWTGNTVAEVDRLLAAIGPIAARLRAVAGVRR